jgi:dienelactone hydrolase
MMFLKREAEAAVVLLHEIYGVNRFIEEAGREFYGWGFDVYCPDLIGSGACYPYSESDQAYVNFLGAGGFEQYVQINNMMRGLKQKYARIILIGFSAGATIAWRCTQSKLCDRMVGVYGSRIRDYREIEPECGSLLLFADKEKSFDVRKLADDLRNKKNTSVILLEGSHGFMDPYSKSYDKEPAIKAINEIREFIRDS